MLTRAIVERAGCSHLSPRFVSRAFRAYRAAFSAHPRVACFAVPAGTGGMSYGGRWFFEGYPKYDEIYVVDSGEDSVTFASLMHELAHHARRGLDRKGLHDAGFYAALLPLYTNAGVSREVARCVEDGPVPEVFFDRLKD